MVVRLAIVCSRRGPPVAVSRSKTNARVGQRESGAPRCLRASHRACSGVGINGPKPRAACNTTRLHLWVVRIECAAETVPVHVMTTNTEKCAACDEATRFAVTIHRRMRANTACSVKRALFGLGCSCACARALSSLATNPEGITHEPPSACARSHTRPERTSESNIEIRGRMRVGTTTKGSHALTHLGLDGHAREARAWLPKASLSRRTRSSLLRRPERHPALNPRSAPRTVRVA